MRPTFLKQDALEERVLVPKHKTFVGSSSLALLESGQRFFILLDRCLELLDVLGSSFAKGCLGLTVALLTFLGCCIYLPEISHDMECKVCESLKSDSLASCRLCASGVERAPGWLAGYPGLAQAWTRLSWECRLVQARPWRGQPYRRRRLCYRPSDAGTRFRPCPGKLEANKATLEVPPRGTRPGCWIEERTELVITLA